MSDIPWALVGLGSVAQIEMGQAPSSRYVSDAESPGAVPFLQGNAEFSEVHPNARLWCRRPAKMASQGDALISVRAPVGELNVADQDYGIGRGLAAIRFRDVHPRYGYHQLALRRRDLYRVAQGSTFDAVGSKELKSVAIPVASPEEQRQIATVLDSLDDQIRVTEQVVSKLRASFVGLLYSLLTRGMELDRASSVDAVLEFGDTSIRLPKRWTIESIGQLLAPVDPAMRSGPFGSALLKHELVESGVPILGIDNVHVDRFATDFRRFVTPAKAAELSRYLVRPDDVMITIMGTVGRSCLVPQNIGPALSSKHVWTLTLDRDRYRPYLVSLQLNHTPWARAHLRRDEQGGIMSAIRSETLKTLMLPTPPVDEQIEIEEILKAVESKIANGEQSLNKLRHLRVGLAEDLLSGRVRVPAEVAS